MLIIVHFEKDNTVHFLEERFLKYSEKLKTVVDQSLKVLSSNNSTIDIYIPKGYSSHWFKTISILWSMLENLKLKSFDYENPKAIYQELKMLNCNDEQVLFCIEMGEQQIQQDINNFFSYYELALYLQSFHALFFCLFPFFQMYQKKLQPSDELYQMSSLFENMKL